ncbi:MAG: hypothetical protein EZS26_000241 [Candidatus Ordinivivax streblomastigis]|uniref:Uncharacterized protein n=1 Tax=Candidatus Ordinivivax streblomastigis TaxID=2540710 RepID=A0A5M8P651_9BACT|nr:MAG: hypothetical protein EZS26_000241 [Candidatus Ordinivivax streblomastigis]
MKLEKEFKAWLVFRSPDTKTATSRISNCRTVEEYHGDLETHFETDRCNDIISKLTYTTDDEREKREAKHLIPTKGILRTNSATYKQAVGLYVDFRDELSNGFSIGATQQNSSNINTKEVEERESKSKGLSHHEFHDFSSDSDVEKTIAIVLGKVCHFIHPRIVDKIRNANIEFKEEFRVICGDLDIDTFLFDGSDCVFPGVRRFINREKKETKKNAVNSEDNTILDGNEVPRRIWAFLSQNKSYSGPMWSDSGLSKFELAHIFGHKTDEKDLERKVFKEYDNTKLPYALFTSASNTVLIPNGLMKPTDKCESIKIAFYKRHIELYGNNFYAEKGFKEDSVPEWYNEIKWLEPDLPLNWEEKINNLLAYRKKYLFDKYAVNKK